MTAKTAQSKQQPTETVETLSDGRKAVVEKFYGRHIRQARRMAQEAGIDFTFALIAQVTKIDGAGITPEDLDDMPGNDVIRLQEVVQGN